MRPAGGSNREPTWKALRNPALGPDCSAQDLCLLPLLLEGGGSGVLHVQQPAAAAIANLCSDPALVAAELGGTPDGLGPVVALALSADEEVQRSAAAALWHLAVHPEARALAVQAGALPALLPLAVQQRNVVARELARQALVRCCAEDEALRAQLEGAAAARGLEAGEVAALLKPSSARSFASFTQRNVHHRKLHSGEPLACAGPRPPSCSAVRIARRHQTARMAWDPCLCKRPSQLACGHGLGGVQHPSPALHRPARPSRPVPQTALCILPADIPSSASGAVSRSSSFRSAADASPFSSRATQLGDVWAQASGSQAAMAVATPVANGGPSSSPGPEAAHGTAATGADAEALAAASVHAPAGGPASASSKADGGRAAPAPVHVPQAPSLPLPLPIITPVSGHPDSPLAAAKEQDAQQPQEQSQAARLHAAAATAEVAASSPRGVVAHRLQQLERTASGLGSSGASQF